MKAIQAKTTALFLFSFTSSAMGATPFTISGSKIGAIFSSSEIWSKLNGEVANIKLLSSDEKVTQYELTTSEYTQKTSSGEFKILKTPLKCKIQLDVVNNGDVLAPSWGVKNINFADCPVGLPLM